MKLALVGLGAVLLTFALARDAGAAPGDFIRSEIVSTTSGPTGVSYGLNNRVSWINQSGDIWQGPDNDPSNKILNSINPAHSWKFLDKTIIGGKPFLTTFDETESKVYRIAIWPGNTFTNWEYSSGAEFFKGICFEGTDTWIYDIVGNSFTTFNSIGWAQDRVALPWKFPKGKGIAKTKEGFIMNDTSDANYYGILVDDENNYQSYTTYYYNVGPGDNASFLDVAFNPRSGQIILASKNTETGEGKINYYESHLPPNLETKIGIFRPSTGLWAIKGVTRAYFGESNDIPVILDYSGDGTENIAIFRPSNGLWAVKDLTRAYFGNSSDITVPDDYDGNGKPEFAIFRPSTGMWAARKVTKAYFGNINDIPVPENYNSDRFTEQAIFRPSAGLWAVRGVTKVYFGNSEDVPVPSDYEGNGIPQLGIFRANNGLWAVKGFTKAYFGNTDDIPVPADYSFNGNSDIAVFRPANGLWAVKGVTRAYFGNSGDIPVAR